MSDEGGEGRRAGQGSAGGAAELSNQLKKWLNWFALTSSPSTVPLFYFLHLMTVFIPSPAVSFHFSPDSLMPCLSC